MRRGSSSPEPPSGQGSDGVGQKNVRDVVDIGDDAIGGAPGFTYLVMANKDLDQVLRLVDAIRRRVPDERVLLVWNGELDAVDEARVAEAGIRRIGSGRSAVWGTYSLIERALEAFGDVGPDQWAVLVPGDCYPTGDLRAWQDRTLERDVDAVLFGWPIAWDDSRMRARLEYRWVTWDPPEGRWGVLAFRGVNSMAYRLFGTRDRLRCSARAIAIGHRRRKDPPTTMVNGVLWCALSPFARRRLLELVRRPDVADTFQDSLIPDESLIHTIAWSDGWSKHRATIMHMEWPYDGSPHPRDLGPDDLVAVRQSQAPFARKVNGEAGDALVRLLEGLEEEPSGRQPGEAPR